MSQFWSDFPRVLSGLDRIRTRMESLTDRLPAELQSEFRPLVRRQGKSLRAGLVLLAGTDCPADRQEALDSTAAAVELLHLATLVHDDIVDQSALRRGEPALHHRLGLERAVLYGDLLFAACFRVVTQEVGGTTARSLADLVMTMAISELQQLNDRFRIPVSRRRVLRRTLGKTALLFSLCLFAGAQEAGLGDSSSRSLRRAGYSLGMAFQIQDDLLDWTGRPETLGKPVWEDLLSGVYAWPVAVAWRRAARRTRDELVAVRDGGLSPSDLAARWEATGVFETCQDTINLYIGRARRDLDAAWGHNNPQRDEWERFITALLLRQR